MGYNLNMQYWLMKSEPGEFSLADLQRKQRAFWDGIRNYQVRNMLRDDMMVGDRALFYHSNAGAETGVVGVMEVVEEATPDPAQFDPASKYYDAASTRELPRWLGVWVEFREVLPRVVGLAELKNCKSFFGSPLVQKGNRLSVMQLSKAQFEKVILLARK